MKAFKVILSVIFCTLLASTAVEAQQYVRYVDANLHDAHLNSATSDCQNYDPSSGSCSGGSAAAFATTADVNKFINSLQSGDTAKIHFQRGDTWVINNSEDVILMVKNGVKVTLDAFGSGAAPIFDGLYNTGNYDPNSKYLIRLEASGQTIKDITFQNSYHHVIMVAAGTGHLISNCRFIGIGSAGVSFESNTGGTIEYCYMENMQKLWRLNPDKLSSLGGWPQAINLNVGHNNKWTVQYNYINGTYGEGIGVGNSIIQYNVLTRIKSVGIYQEGVGKGIIRGNLVIGTHETPYAGVSRDNRLWSAGGIVLNHENNNADIDGTEVYKNIVIDSLFGIQLKNSGTSGDALTIENVNVHDNLLIDNWSNFNRASLDKYAKLILKDNVSVVYDGSAANQVSAFGTDARADAVIGPNQWNSVPKYGSLFTSNKDILSDPQLPKRSGWYKVTSLGSFSLSDLVPANLKVSNTSLLSTTSTSQTTSNSISVGSGFKTIPNLMSFGLTGTGTGIMSDPGTLSPPVLNIVSN
jgi:Right handed beta helix region